MWLQGAHAEVSGYHCESACSSDLQAFATAWRRLPCLCAWVSRYQWFRAFLLCYITFLAFRWSHLGCPRVGECRQEPQSLRILPGVRCYPGGGNAVGANFGWAPWFSLLCGVRVARLSLARAVATVVLTAGQRVLTSSFYIASRRTPHPWCVLLIRWPTSPASSIGG